MQFVNNLNNLGPDDTYFMEQSTPLAPAQVPTGAVGLLGTFSRGPVNKPVTCYSYNDIVRNFGEVDQAFTLTGTIEARSIYAQGNTAVTVVRVQSQANPAEYATVIITDASGATVATLQAYTPGTWGDGLTATTSTGTIANTFKVQLQYGSESETWDNLIVAQPTTPITGAVLFSTVFNSVNGTSQLATGTTPTTPNTNLPKNQVWTFTGGNDGTTGITSTDYSGSNTNGTKTGLYALDSAPVNYVIAAGQTDASLNSALSQNATNITQQGGLPRKAIVTFPRATALSSIAALTNAFNSDRVFPCFLYQQIFDPITNANQVVSPLGFYVGLLAQLNPWEVPGNKRINGTIGLDPNVNISAGDIQTINSALCAAVGVEIPAGGIGVRGEFTASQVQGDSQLTYVRDMKDFIDESVFRASGKYVDAPVTDTLLRNIAQAVDQVLYPLKNPEKSDEQAIKDYKIQCDVNNNPDASQNQNRVICDYAVKLLNINRWLIFRTQIGSGVVVKSAQNELGAA